MWTLDSGQFTHVDSHFGSKSSFFVQQSGHFFRLIFDSWVGGWIFSRLFYAFSRQFVPIEHLRYSTEIRCAHFAHRRVKCSQRCKNRLIVGYVDANYDPIMCPIMCPQHKVSYYCGQFANVDTFGPALRCPH